MSYLPSSETQRGKLRSLFHSYRRNKGDHVSVSGREGGMRTLYVGVHTVCEGVDTKAVCGIGSTPGYVTTQEANWGAARPFTSLHQYARYVPTFPDGARLGQGHCCSAGSSAHVKLVADPRCLFDLLRPCRGKPSSHQNMFRRYSRSS